MALEIHVVAVAADGWVIVGIDEDMYWEVAPPYTPSYRWLVPEAHVALCILGAGYSVPSKKEVFSSWDELITTFNERRVAAASPEELEASKGAALKLLRFANRDQVLRQLARLETYYATASFDIRKAVLEALLESDGAKSDKELAERIVAMLSPKVRHVEPPELIPISSVNVSFPPPEDRQAAMDAAFELPDDPTSTGGLL